MLFNSPSFAIFFAVTLVAFVAAPRRYGSPVLLGASFVFYALWMPFFIPLLLGTLVVNYALLRGMVRSSRRRMYLVLSITVTLALLCTFKYSAFVLSLATPIVPSLRPLRHGVLELMLPLGISFYSFEIISVAVDVYRDKLECPSFVDYALFVTFFPHLIAGPIMRGGELIPQLRAGGTRSGARVRRGVWLFAIGLVKKAVLSDHLLLPFVTEVFGTPGAAAGPVHLVALYSFAFQIYFDFSGYTDMARGLASVLGFELTKNFQEPYLSRDLTEFWRRWHMTLSRWLRDYLYVPLGGNRRGPARTLVNLMLTMLLGGMWHGAGLNFLAWGGLHGLYLVARRLRGRERAADAPLGWRDLPSIVVTFHLVCLAWLPFRAVTWSDSVAFMRGLVSGGYLTQWPVVPLAIVALCAALHVLERAMRPRLPAIQARVADALWGPWLEGALLGSVLSVSVLASGGGVEFIYFRF
jgi:D-alanyl-lipoteichoic acid acyltransferase DltB (MBOAT superfamily)